MPLSLDVLTMAARAGYTPRLALATTARWSPSVVGTVLATVETRCRLGSSLADALDDIGRVEPVLRDVTDALAVAERSGAPIADLLARLAEDARVALRRRSEAHARRVPVRLLFPLVFLVLPAFGLLTVVPALAAGLRNS
ncbi:MAG: type II secretion system F family protein [Acidimicrobiia bacterium]